MLLKEEISHQIASQQQKKITISKTIDTIVIFEVKVGAKMLNMLYSTLGMRTAKAPLVKEEKAKKEHKKFLVIQSFKRTYYTRMEDTLKIRLTADIELINHHIPLQYNL